MSLREWSGHADDSGKGGGVGERCRKFNGSRLPPLRGTIACCGGNGLWLLALSGRSYPCWSLENLLGAEGVEDAVECCCKVAGRCSWSLPLPLPPPPTLILLLLLTGGRCCCLVLIFCSWLRRSLSNLGLLLCCCGACCSLSILSFSRTRLSCCSLNSSKRCWCFSSCSRNISCCFDDSTSFTWHSFSCWWGSDSPNIASSSSSSASREITISSAEGSLAKGAGTGGGGVGEGERGDFGAVESRWLFAMVGSLEGAGNARVVHYIRQQRAAQQRDIK